MERCIFSPRGAAPKELSEGEDISCVCPPRSVESYSPLRTV
jgi:hypothetical protein